MRTRIKICGITRTADLQLAARLGADAAGLVFQPGSPRCLSTSLARSLVAARLPFLSLTALFMDPAEQEVSEVIRSVNVDCLQFHGAESADFCASFGMPYIKAVPMGSLDNPRNYIRRYADSAAGIVLDSHRVGKHGGTGETFDWSKAEEDYGLPAILAGGLTPENVGESIKRLNPYGVDVSSGVESAPGMKDNELMKRFIASARSADEQKKRE